VDIDDCGDEDGTEVILWPEKERSLVDSMRTPESHNQVFFVDVSGALCSRASGHAIDVEEERLVLRHRRPITYPFPNAYSHPIPKFTYEKGQISVQFSADPNYPAPGTYSSAWLMKSYILTSIPMRKPRTMIDDASAFLSSAVTTPLAFFGGITGISGPGAPKATPEEVFQSDIDLNEDEVLEQDRGEEAEIDDSPEGIRRVRVLTVDRKFKEGPGEKALLRRQWEVVPLLNAVRRTGAI